MHDGTGLAARCLAMQQRRPIGRDSAEIPKAFGFRQRLDGLAVGSIADAPHERYTARNALPASIGPSLHRFPRTVSPAFGAKKSPSHVSARL